MPGLLATPSHVHRSFDGSKTYLPKERGGDQGDGLTGLVFPLVYKRVTQATEQAARQHDQEARANTYQDDLDLVCTPAAIPAARQAFCTAAGAVGLRSNQAKDTLSPGPGCDVAALPTNLSDLLEPRALVLRHGAPVPVPALPAASAVPGTLLAESSPEAAALLDKRKRFLDRLKALRKAGLSALVALSLAQLR